MFLDLCDSADCIEQAAWILRSLEPDVDPCDNFYEFVCNFKIRQRTELTPTDTDITNFFSINSNQTNLILSKVKDVYNTCINTEETEKHFKEFLDSVDSWGLLKRESDTFDWRLFLYKARRHGLRYDMLFTFNVVEDTNNSCLRVKIRAYVIFLLINQSLF